MQKGSDALRILDKKGNELVFSVSNFRRGKAAMQAYANYAEVAIEFFEWAFKTEEQKKQQEENLQMHQQAVQDEMDSIRRSLIVIEGNSQTNQQSTSQKEESQTVQSTTDQQEYAMQEIDNNREQIESINKLLASI